MQMLQLTVAALQGFLQSANAVLASGIAIFSSALLLYLIVYNPHSRVVRAFCLLLVCVLLTYFVDLALIDVENVSTARLWLRLQWVGIAFAPAAYLEFSNALLATTGFHSRARSALVVAGYWVSAAFLAGVAFSELVVREASLAPQAPHLLQGPLFPVFVAYFFASVAWAGVNAMWARSRCLTSTSRRRMTYLILAFPAPAAGVFPYLLLTGWPRSVPGVVFWLLLVLGNIGVGSTLVILTYSVAFFGAFTPDRVVKHRLARFALRGPLLATLVVLIIVALWDVEAWLGLPGRRLILFGVVGAIVLLQLVVEIAKPLLDTALYRQDLPEVEQIQQLANRLLTGSDVKQFLENVLTALCDLLRVQTAFVTSLEAGAPRLEAVCGSIELAPTGRLGSETLREVLDAPGETDGPQIKRHGEFFIWDGFWLAPMRAAGQDKVIGVVGVEARSRYPDLSDDERAGLESLLAQAAAALEDRQLQREMLAVLEGMIPDIEDIQQRGAALHYTGEEALAGSRLVEAEDFRKWVRGALSHYWGGPMLTNSPLLSLNVVDRAARALDGSVLKGLRAVLREAIEHLRPDGKRQMTAPEWILYNILELKFLQGRRVRDIAQRLAMSESDLYRKQRVAIEEVARVLADMEREELSG